jgi:rhodanese-related sulfurtransferase
MDESTKREFKDKIYEQFERVAQALASARRLELLDLLAQGERSVEALATETSMSVANTSRHLHILRAAQVVEVRRDGSYNYYRLGDERVSRVWQALRELAEARLAEIDWIVHTFLKDRDTLDRVDVAELRRRLKDSSVTVLDVRPEVEYRAGHIAGARSVPMPELLARLREIPKDQEVVAYCRGPYCVFADEAVGLLRAHGYRARRFELGFPGWKAQGLPVEVASRG